jgi:thiamine-monophosphate kinase
MKLSQIGELCILEYIRNIFDFKAKEVLVGIGDDSSVIMPNKRNLLVTSDMMVEGIHFDLRFVTPYQIGFKLLSVNVSDIFAMGGTPCYVLLNLAFKRNTTKEFFDLFMRGITDAMNLYHVRLIGGDLSSARKEISTSATVIGYADKYLKRSGARPGDRIYVTGYLGDSAYGLEILKKTKKRIHIELGLRGEKIKAFRGISWNTIAPLVRRHLLPEARSPKKFLKHATAMIDISDGLLIDLTRICNESKVGARIYLKQIPVSPSLKKVSRYLKNKTGDLSLSGGEDYELLFTAPPQKKVNAIHIGEITVSQRVIVGNRGRTMPFKEEGYQHFGIKREK